MHKKTVKKAVPMPVRGWGKGRHNKYMDEDVVVLSSDAAKILSGVLEMHIASNLVKEAPAESRDRLEKELGELNKIQTEIEDQLDVSRSR